MNSNLNYVAVIGTAGRDKAAPLSLPLWNAMLDDLKNRLDPSTDILVSGGAAWADHLAVVAYLEGWCKDLVLYLPAPINDSGYAQAYAGGRTAAGAANYYHARFSQLLGINSIDQINKAIKKGATTEHEPFGQGLGAMFARNKKVARKATQVIAYTFGEGDTPLSGGTKDTWDQIKSEKKIHVSLSNMARGLTHTERQKIRPQRRFSFSQR